MTINLFIASASNSLIIETKSVFSECPEVVVLNETFVNFKKFEVLDAVIMLQRHALETFGGLPVPEKSLIISTKDKPDFPRWIVTTPPHLAHLKQSYSNNRFEVTIEQDIVMLPYNETLEYFTKMFNSIVDFNATNPAYPIENLGLHLDAVYIKPIEVERIRAIKEAYLDFRIGL